MGLVEFIQFLCLLGGRLRQVLIAGKWQDVLNYFHSGSDNISEIKFHIVFLPSSPNQAPGYKVNVWFNRISDNYSRTSRRPNLNNGGAIHNSSSFKFKHQITSKMVN